MSFTDQGNVEFLSSLGMFHSNTIILLSCLLNSNSWLTKIRQITLEQLLQISDKSSIHEKFSIKLR